MNNPDSENTLAWLAKAKRDLDSAAKLAEGDTPYLDTAIYHLQQAGEKAVKGFLVWRDQPFEKTHDIRLLTMLAAETNTDFNKWREVAALLTPYATEFRYPDDYFEPSQEEFDEAIDAATKFYDFILSQLPKEVHP